MKLRDQFLRNTPKLHGSPVPVVGLTGGIATGKSTVSKLLRKHGLTVIDADQLVKAVYTEKDTHDFLRQNCPEGIKGDEVNFPRLRERFFSNPELKKKIENFIYQRLPAAFLKSYEAAGRPECVVYDVPLLFEKGLQDKVDLKVLVYAPRKIQLARVISRDKHETELAEKILDQQMDIEQKRSLSDVIIDNSQTEAELEIEVKNFVSSAFH